jgi:hypothetical protein
MLARQVPSYILTVDYIKSKEIKLALGSENLDNISPILPRSNQTKIQGLHGQPQLLCTHDDTLTSTRQY